VERQARAALTGLDGDTVARRVTLAYEPVWAIGTGHVATPEQARQAHAELRELLAALFGSRTAAATTLQYGGSVKPDNIAELLDCPDVNGALVGGASLDPNSFRALLGACATQASGARTN